MAKKKAKPAAPTWTVEQLRALIAARDPNTAAAIAEYGKPDVGTLLIDLYREGSDFGRAAAMDALRRVRFGKGYWQAAKKIYKLAEPARNAAFVGYLAYRIDADDDYSHAPTRAYMRRRAWRFLRRLARQSPTNYPYFAAEVLIHYRPADLEGASRRTRFLKSDVWKPGYNKWSEREYAKWDWYEVDTALKRWVVGNILHRRDPKLERTKASFRPKDTSGDHRFPAINADCAVAFPELWKRSAEPLLHVALKANHEPIRGWAIGRLRADHAEALRRLPTAAVVPFLQSPSEPAALFGWELLTLRPPELVDTDAVLAALVGPHAALTAKAAEFILWNFRRGRVPLDRWVVFAVGAHAGAAEFAAKWLRNHHLEDLTWAELSRLLASPHAAARAAALEAIPAGHKLLRAEPDAFAAALDTPFEDVRAALCGRILGVGLSPEAMFALLDLPYADVQAVAREQIESHMFSPAGPRPHKFDRPEFLVFAAESPDDGVMQWVADMVIRRLSDEAGRLRELTPFFRRVLYRVNVGGPVKRRLLVFLRQTVERFPDQAAVALPLLAEFTRSIGKREFAAALSATVRLAVERPDMGERLRSELPGLRIEDEVIR